MLDATIERIRARAKRMKLGLSDEELVNLAKAGRR